MSAFFKFLIILLFGGLMPCVSQGQKTLMVTEFEKVENEWLPLGELKGVVVFYEVLDCDFNSGFDQRWIVLKFENTTDKSLTVTYEKDLYYNGECKTCNMDEYYYSISLPAHSEVHGWCTRKEGPELNAFVKSIDPAVVLNDKLTKFELTNINILPNE